MIYKFFKEEGSLNFRLIKIDETRNYLLDEIKHIDLMSEKNKRTFKYLNYVEHLHFFCFNSYWFRSNF